MAQSSPAQVVFGCGWNNNGKSFIWDVANNSTSELDECPNNTRGMKFHVMADGVTVLGASIVRRLFFVDHTQSAGSVFTRANLNREPLADEHVPPMSMLVPRSKATCLS